MKRIKTLEEVKLERDKQVTQAKNKDILGQQLEQTSLSLCESVGRKLMRAQIRAVTVCLNGTPEWVPTVENESKSDEEVELSLQGESTGTS